MIRIKNFIICALFLLSIAGCRDDLKNSEKYSRPDWLAGKLFDQIKAQPDLSKFMECLELTGYDTIINTSGSYTVFAPNDEAFALYFQSHPQYATVADIPRDELLRIIKFHIVQNPWSLQQLKSLDVYGWIDSTDRNNDKPKGYKRLTLLREKDQKYGVKYNQDRIITIVDTLKSPWYRRQFTDSRKYVPLFYKEYFDIYDLSSNDYAFYFDRPFDPKDIFFAGSMIVKGDIFAENGFVHIIDRVNDPMKNAYQILSEKKENILYTKFLDLVNVFPEFTYNRQATIDQPGAEEGLTVDSLFDITYPDLAFNITNELTKSPQGTYGLPSNVTIRYHHGMIAPTNDAFDDFVNEFFIGPGKWGSLENTPIHIKRMMVNSQMSANAIYPSDFSKGFYNGEKDFVTFDPATVVETQYGSNCTFIGSNKMIVPRAFSSITGPIYLSRGFEISMYAIEKTGLLAALKKEDVNYSLFVESDADLRTDSSLLYYPTTENFAAFRVVKDQLPTRTNFSTIDMRILVMNHVGIETPRGIARKEFIKNLAGNYIIIDNETGEYSGTAPSTVGYQGGEIAHVIPELISSNADNGNTYSISNWFSFASINLYTRISGSFPKFHNLLKKAGLANDKLYKYSFLSDNDFYTVFIPSDSALDAYQVDTLSIPDLKNFLRFHFVQGEMIFTDGNMSPKYYETSRIDEKSTPFTTVFTKLYIEPGFDVIDFPGKSGTTYLSVPESDSTNIIAARDLSNGTQQAFTNSMVNAVIHKIDKVLVPSDMDTQ
jgi:uncharacterized surface protein with fasciclin (FAS1) repeats